MQLDNYGYNDNNLSGLAIMTIAPNYLKASMNSPPAARTWINSTTLWYGETQVDASFDCDARPGLAWTNIQDDYGLLYRD